MSGRREETTMQNENQTPNLTEKEKETIEKTAQKGKEWAHAATEKGKEVLHDTRETVADVVEPEDTKRAREEANKSMLEKGKDYTNSAAEAISNMFSTDQKEGDKNDNDKQ